MMGAISTEFYFISYVAIAAGTALSVFFIYRRNPHKISSIFLLFASLFTSLWVLVSASKIYFPSKIDIHHVIPYVFAGTASVMFAFFSLSFTRNRLFLSNSKIALVLLPYALSLTSLLIFSGAFVTYKTVDISYGWIHALFIGSIIFYTTLAARQLWFRYKASAGVFRAVLRPILFVYIGVSILTILLSITHTLTNVEIFRFLSFLLLFLGFLFVSFSLAKFYRWRIKPYTVEVFVGVISVILFLQFILSDSIRSSIINAIVFFLFIPSGYYLIRNINHEARLQDEIENLVKDLKDANDQLQMLDRRKSEFVKISAHHLKSPLTAIKGYASMIVEGSFGELNNDAKEAVNKIFTASQRLVGIINDFMDISNIESGTMEYIFDTVDLKKLIEGVMEEMKMTIEKSGLKVTFNTDEISGYEIMADSNKLRQVISNLTDNAIKYTPKGTVHLFLKKEKSKGTTHLTITDTGIGMSKETINNLFEKFSRAHDANKVNTGGSGLGLYVAKEIMKKHSAKIWVESPGEGMGSTFHLVFDTFNKKGNL